jgi:hypothetical protein
MGCRRIVSTDATHVESQYMKTSVPDCRRVYGVDFSGAKDAGRKIWVAECIAETGGLVVENCDSLAERAGKKERGASIEDLVRLIEKSGPSIFGLDFPFGIHETVVQNLFGECTWCDLVTKFDAQFATPDEFRKACYNAAGGKELRRRTDLEASTPLAPSNLRLFKQTYYGMRDLLGPLVRNGTVRVLPMQDSCQELPCLIEICPASTLKRHHLYSSYKGKKDAARSNRKSIIEKLRSQALSIPSEEVMNKILANTDGDALDSVIAAFAAYLACLSGFKTGPNEYHIEGYVFC